MLNSRTHRCVSSKTPLMLGAAALVCSTYTNALQFQSGEANITFNTQVTLGASWRANDADKELLAGANVEGATDFSQYASSSTADDGDLNYQKHDLFSLVTNVRHDLGIDYKNLGAFARVRYWYDNELADGDVPHGNSLNNYEPNKPLGDSEFSDLAQASGIELMDAYIYGSWDLGNMPLDARLGRQVVSWGESTFIQNSVNIINPVDVSALRRPGAELKDALLPVGMLYGSIGLTLNLTLEAFLQYEWEQVQLEGCGTYFSSVDLASEGCDKLTLFSTLTPYSDFDAIAQGPFNATGGFVPRAEDNEASDSGQYGVALRYFADNLNSTEFGLFYVNYHSRTPVFSVIPADPGAGAGPYYFFDYPEDIEVFATSFNTSAFGWAISGELSYRPDMPIAINTTDLVQPLVSGLAEYSPMFSVVRDPANAGQPILGYDEHEFTQLQFTFIKFFERVLGASRLSTVGEIGFDWVGGLPDVKDGGVRYERSPTFGTYFEGAVGPFSITCEGVANLNPDNCTADGYLTDFAWGYRLRGVLEYPNVFAGVTLKPGLAWSHDVEGWSPAPNFNEGSKAVSLSLDASYLNKYNLSFDYTDFRGGDFNVLRDRDFFSISLGFSF